MIFIDSNVILRFLLADDPILSPKAKSIIEKVARGETSVYLSSILVAEIVYVLLKVYKLRRSVITEKLMPLLQLEHVKTENKMIFKEAFRLFRTKAIDFEDAYTAALMNKKKTKELYSFDHDFDSIYYIKRLSE